MPKLGVNIDHVATLRQLRRSSFPDILQAARICERAGADSIVVHLREDRRHVQDADVHVLRRSVKTKLNLEMSIASEIVRIAVRIRPHQSTLVPERRQELTTEGGLNVIKLAKKIDRAVTDLRGGGIPVSIFIEPDRRQIKVAKELGVEMVELHTGRYANSNTQKNIKSNLLKLKAAADYAYSLGLIVNAGHGLDYTNVGPIAHMKNIHELNIGYSIICSSVFIGLRSAVQSMRKLIQRG